MITPKEVRHIARLARIDLLPAEEIEMGGQLQKIIDYVRKLDEIDTSSVKPSGHPIELPHVVREDKAEKSMLPEEVLKNAPEQEDEFFTVPKVIEKNF